MFGTCAKVMTSWKLTDCKAAYFWFLERVIVIESFNDDEKIIYIWPLIVIPT
jgi:hypothetical protein